MKMIKYMIIILAFASYSVAFCEDFNSPVSGSAKISTKVIKPLQINPDDAYDYLDWPTVPVGDKYIFGASSNEDSDTRSIFKLYGEPNSDVSITVIPEKEVSNVEISYLLKGTDIQYVGNQIVPALEFSEGNEVVRLNNFGYYYLHIVYEWVWAKENSTPGEKIFTQTILVCYTNL